MRCVLEDVAHGVPTAGSPCPPWGLYLVISPVPGLGVGDLVRVVCTSSEGSWAYLLKRTRTTLWPVSLADADRVAADMHLYAHVPRHVLRALSVPDALVSHPIGSADMETFLTRAPHLVPRGGWGEYIRGSGVRGVHTPPSSWQFHARFWGDTYGGTRTGKTGGLHMSESAKGTRLCQLSVECGVLGDSLVDTLSRTTSGVLVYLPSMDVRSNVAAGEDVNYESNLTLAFSALLITYVEMVSEVRHRIHTTPGHALCGVDYSSLDWDHTHQPYSRPWVAASDPSKIKTIDLLKLARARARVWLAAERVAAPHVWGLPDV